MKLRYAIQANRKFHISKKGIIIKNAYDMSKKRWTYVSSEKLCHKAIEAQKYVCVSSILASHSLVSGAKMIPIIDVDSYDDLTKALYYIERHLRVGYCIIESTPEQHHYWVVLDIIDKISTVLNLIQEIPGVDKQYVKYGVKYRDLVLRAVPKLWTIPIFDLNSHTLETPAVIDWVYAFKDHFYNTGMHGYLLSCLNRAVADENLNKLDAFLILGGISKICSARDVERLPNMDLKSSVITVKEDLI